MQLIRWLFSVLYEDYAEHPELARFRRYLKEISWMLYDQNAEIQLLRDEINAIIKDLQGFGNGNQVFDVTDLHRVHVPGRKLPRSLKKKIDRLKRMIRQYNKDLIDAHTIAQFPDQSRVCSRWFARRPGLYENGRFEPTGESKMYYEHPPHADTCTLRDMGCHDLLTEFFINNYEAVSERFRKKSEGDADPDAPTREGIKLSIIEAVSNIIACTYISLIFTASIAILFCLEKTRNRIVVAGILGIILLLSILLLAPSVKRSEVVAIIAGYFAIAAVFIGTSDHEGR
ncbi:hypothetical protein K504DRAFT_537413 [Pleomassaria siparia CBS 279.74]|uniref:DUF6594 domain-containing protein n=1 Tax=Pleomassaria siparia CBS 279.74 TaxID=1314801 RepID=A0A6G1JYV6_9PLEO|nr:hypothetical protein K504DRAFT_537413 [Pleomassaria siparia CBS 279.74]